MIHKLSDLIPVKIDGSEEEGIPSEPSSDDRINKLRELDEQDDAIQEMKRFDDPDIHPVNLGFVECPVCGYGCEGFFLNNTGYPQRENEEGFFDSMDDYCEHLRYVKKDLAYFLKSN